MNYLPEPTAEGDAPIRNRIHQQITLYLGNYFALPIHLILVENSLHIQNYSATTQASHRKISQLMRDIAHTFGFSFHTVSNKLRYIICPILMFYLHLRLLAMQEQSLAV